MTCSCTLVYPMRKRRDWCRICINGICILYMGCMRNRTEALWVHRLMFVLMGLSDCRMQLLTYLCYIPALPVHKCEKDALVRRQKGPEDSYPSLAGRWGDQVDSTQRESNLTSTLQLLTRWTLPSPALRAHAQNMWMDLPHAVSRWVCLSGCSAIAVLMNGSKAEAWHTAADETVL